MSGLKKCKIVAIGSSIDAVDLHVLSTTVGAGAVSIVASDTDASTTITVTSAGTGAAAVDIEATTGGVTVTAGTNITLAPDSGTVDVSNKRITSVATPVSGTDAPNKTYVDSLGANAATAVYITNANYATTLGAGNATSDTLYIIDGSIDCGSVSITIPTGGLFLAGWSMGLSKLTSSDTSFTLFTSNTTSGDLVMRDLDIEITGTSSQVYNLVGVVGPPGPAIEINAVNYNNCTSLGTISVYRQGLETGTGRFGGTPQLTLAGAWTGGFRISTSIVRVIDSGSYYLFKAGASFTMASRFLTDLNCDLPATVGFLDFAPANFTNPSSLELRDVRISRAGVFDNTDSLYMPNIDETALQSSWKSNVGINNTYEGGGVEVTSSTATVIVTVDTFVEIVATTWTPFDLEHFQIESLGRLQHLDATSQTYRVECIFTVKGTANDDVTIRLILHDGTTPTTVISRQGQIANLSGNNDYIVFTFSTRVTMAENDYVYWEIANNTGTNNFTLVTGSQYSLAER